MAYDLPRDRVVMWGGTPDDSSRTWEFDGFAWTAVATPPHPPGSVPGASMAFDFASSRTPLVQSSQVNSNTTGLWSWDGMAWTQVPSANALALPGRMDAALAYDFGRARTVMFGGFDTCPRGDTWEWDGTAWHTATPPARWVAPLAFDTARGAAVLFGGFAEGGRNTLFGYRGDTWEWRGVAWHF